VGVLGGITWDRQVRPGGRCEGRIRKDSNSDMSHIHTHTHIYILYIDTPSYVEIISSPHQLVTATTWQIELVGCLEV
jgi:hypothetical protein